jgi:hypothetical protein
MCVSLCVCRKSFIETRSIGAVAVAFSRVYILHAILLCWMTLLVGGGLCLTVGHSAPQLQHNAQQGPLRTVVT